MEIWDQHLGLLSVTQFGVEIKIWLPPTTESHLDLYALSWLKNIPSHIFNQTRVRMYPGTRHKSQLALLYMLKGMRAAAPSQMPSKCFKALLTSQDLCHSSLLTSFLEESSPSKSTVTPKQLSVVGALISYRDKIQCAKSRSALANDHFPTCHMSIHPTCARQHVFFFPLLYKILPPDPLCGFLWLAVTEQSQLAGAWIWPHSQPPFQNTLPHCVKGYGNTVFPW